MGFSLLTSHQLELLAQKMSDDLKTSPKSIFIPQTIITQTSGMDQWLIEKIAATSGIAANLQFLKPGQLIENIYNKLFPNEAKTINRNDLDWLVYQALSEDDFKNKFKLQYQYFLTKEGKTINETKKWELAAKIADLFDQYQVYRYDIIKKWDKGQMEEKEKKYQWQQYLWGRIKELSGDAFPDQTLQHQKIKEKLKSTEGQEIIKEHFPSISIFGISIITPFHLEILYKLSDHIDIHFYLLDPAPEYFWQDDKTEKHLIKKKIDLGYTQGNDLLANCGKIIQSTYKTLYREDDQLLNVHETIGSLGLNQEIDSLNLLQKIQNDIYNNKVEGIYFDSKDLKDKSIQVSSVYTIQSEVQALYNYLLNVVANQEDGHIKERDMLVMVTDIDAYAPFIRSVFENAPYKFNFSIADYSLAKGNSWQSAFLSILNLDEKQFFPEKVLKLLESIHIQRKFGIEDTELIRRTVRAAQIRWGISNRDKDDTYLVSWVYGMKKIMYGLCMEGSQLTEDKNGDIFYSLEITDSQYETQQISRFVFFVERLIQYFSERKEDRTLEQWAEFAKKIVEEFFIIDSEEDGKSLNQFLWSWNPLNIFPDILPNMKVPFEVISKRMGSKLEDSRTEQNFLYKGITFCSPLPFRSIPFKVIAFLGLNSEVFPRKERMADYDMIKSDPKIGDRNIKENDKHLFLESILSAREKLYLSYIGSSVKDNSELPASPLLEELLDYIQKGIDASGEDINVRKELIDKKPLHLFSNKYDSNAHPNYLIYKAKNYPIASKEIEKSHRSEEEKNYNEIKLNDLLKLAESPYELFFKKTLGISLNKDEGKIEETEVFSFDKLEEHIIKNKLIESRLNNEDLSFYFNEEYLKGKLPLKNIKDYYLNQLDENIQQQLDQLDQGITLVAKDFNLPISEYMITGKLSWIDDATKTLYIFVSKESKSFNKKYNRKYKIRACIQYLLARSCDLAEQAYIILLDKKIKLVGITKDESIEQLKEMIKKYEIALDEAILFDISADESIINDSSSLLNNLIKDYDNYINYAKNIFAEKVNNMERFIEFRDLFIKSANNCIET